MGQASVHGAEHKLHAAQSIPRSLPKQRLVPRTNAPEPRRPRRCASSLLSTAVVALRLHPPNSSCQPSWSGGTHSFHPTDHTHSFTPCIPQLHSLAGVTRRHSLSTLSGHAEQRYIAPQSSASRPQPHSSLSTTTVATVDPKTSHLNGRPLQLPDRPGDSKGHYRIATGAASVTRRSLSMDHHTGVAIVARNANSAGVFSVDDPLMSKLLIALLVLVLVGLTAALVLLFLRYRRHSMEQRESLPTYSSRPSSVRSNHRRLAIRPESNLVFQEKQTLIEKSDSPPPDSPIPEIRITFPEEVDKSGRPTSRVVVVHVGDKSVGFEPYTATHAHYQRDESDRFQSLDLDRIGGLKEKEYK